MERVVERVVEVQVPVERIVERIVEVDRPVPVPQPYRVEVPVPQPYPVENPMLVPPLSVSNLSLYSPHTHFHARTRSRTHHERAQILKNLRSPCAGRAIYNMWQPYRNKVRGRERMHMCVCLCRAHAHVHSCTSSNVYNKEIPLHVHPK